MSFSEYPQFSKKLVNSVTSGYINAVKLVTEIYTPKGICHCEMKRNKLPIGDVVEVDVWQFSDYLEGQITTFCAMRYLKWDGTRYRIVLRRNEQLNAFWQEMEVLLSNIILLNE